MPPLSLEERQTLLALLEQWGCTVIVSEWGPPINAAEYCVYDAFGAYLSGGMRQADALQSAHRALTGKYWHPQDASRHD